MERQKNKRNVERPGHAKRVMTFFIGTDLYAIPAEFIEGIAPLPPVVAVPGNHSRVFIGISYILGQLMSVVDLQPLIGHVAGAPAHDGLIVRYNGDYYALRIAAPGGVALLTLGRTGKKTALPALGVGKAKNMRAVVLDIPELIRKHVCN